MNQITDEELSAIREAQEELMPETVVLQRKLVIAKGEMSWRTVATDEQARITAGAGRFSIVADRFAGITPFSVTLPVGADVLPGDRIIDSASRIYEVRAVHSPKSYLTAVQLLCDLIND